MDVSCSTSAVAVAVAVARYVSNKLQGIHMSEITPFFFFVNDDVRNVAKGV